MARYAKKVAMIALLATLALTAVLCSKKLPSTRTRLAEKKVEGRAA
jgi:hypothetical protein